MHHFSTRMSMKTSISTDSPAVGREVEELSLLFEISQILEQSMNLREVLGPVLDAITTRTDMLRGTIALLDRQTEEISIEAAHGLSKKEQMRGRYRFGEGITGKVIESGKPAVVPNVREDPKFLNRTRARGESGDEDFSFICVPIKLEGKVVGALSADRLLESDERLEGDVQLLSIVASMIAQAVRLRRSSMEQGRRLEEENLRLQRELEEKFRPSNIIGNSRVMRDVYDQLGQVCRSNTTVLLRGESGTGKELLAQAIHYNSARAEKPFVRVNCAALSETLLESELFGHERGAFTGALATRKGRFELAHGGTIFLDEVGDFTPMTQVKLLRVLQEREFERVGGTRSIHIDVRIVAATNQNLEKMIEHGTFRQDLYYRLNVFAIHVPPLRERKTDIVLLADTFVEKYGKANGKQIRRISTRAIDMLMAYHWPGNVRELENCIERGVLLSQDSVIHGHQLPPSLQTAESSGTTMDRTLPALLDNLEKEMIMEALKISRGNGAKAARHLGISDRLMGIRVKKHKIDVKRFRPRS